MESSDQGNNDEFVDVNNIPYPSASSYEFIPADRISGSGESAQRNIFGTHFEKCFDLSAFELDRIDHFNRLVSNDTGIVLDENYQETQHLRFLQGCGWNAELARNSLKEYIVWKKTHNNLNFKPAASHPIVYWYGKDKCLRPILIIRCKEIAKLSVDSQTLRQSLSELLVKHMSFFVDHLTVPDHVEQLVVIVDLDGFSLWDTPFGEIQELIRKLASYFRSRLNKVFLINTPILFYGIWAAIKGFIPTRTVSKIDILGGEYMSCLLHFINHEELCPLLNTTTHYT